MLGLMSENKKGKIQVSNELNDSGGPKGNDDNN